MRFDPVILERIRHLHLRARFYANGLLTGEHRSKVVGAAVEFEGFQAYQPGMDLRFLDWRVLGRTDKLVVRRYMTETEITAVVVLDLSADLGTGDELPDLERSKSGYAITLAATLIYYLHRHGERVGLEIVAGEGIVQRSFMPKSGRIQLQLLLAALASVKPGGVADLGATLMKIGPTLRRRSWVAVISDGMEEPSVWLPALQAFGKRGADLSFVHIFDAAEWRLEGVSPALFYSPENGMELSIDPVVAASKMRPVVEEYVTEVESGVISAGGRYVPAPVASSMQDLLIAIILGSTKRRESVWG